MSYSHSHFKWQKHNFQIVLFWENFLCPKNQVFPLLPPLFSCIISNLMLNDVLIQCDNDSTRYHLSILFNTHEFSIHLDQIHVLWFFSKFSTEETLPHFWQSHGDEKKTSVIVCFPGKIVWFSDNLKYTTFQSFDTISGVHITRFERVKRFWQQSET